MAPWPKRIALIGGGRWARVIASVLRDLLPANVVVIVCSPGNPAGWDKVELPPHWQIAPDLDTTLTKADVSHVIIARRARDHAATALAALRQGKRVLVEKPFCLSHHERDQLLAAAPTQRCYCGLVLLYAGYISDLAHAASALDRIDEISIDWADPLAEQRYGEVKRFDAALSVTQDVFPHIWSLLRRIDPTGEIAIVDVKTFDGGRESTIEMRLGARKTIVHCARNAAARQRLVRLRASGCVLELDFADQPARLRRNGAELPILAGSEGPLAAQLQRFLQNDADPLADIHRCAEIHDLVSAILTRIRAEQREVIKADPDSEGARYGLREILAGGLTGDGQGATIADVAEWLGIAVSSDKGRNLAEIAATFA